jgi:hypothetical protein
LTTGPVIIGSGILWLGITCTGVLRMTTLVEPGTHREWRVNRIRATLEQVSLECGEVRLTRARAQQLAAELQDAAREVADIFICPVCNHPEACTCGECPVGSLTAKQPAA